MILVVFTGYYTLLYWREDKGRHSKATNRSQRIYWSDKNGDNVGSTQRRLRGCYNQYGDSSHNTASSMASSFVPPSSLSSRLTSGPNDDSSTDVLCNDYKPAATKQRAHQRPPVKHCLKSPQTKYETWYSHKYNSYPRIFCSKNAP